MQQAMISDSEACMNERLSGNGVHESEAKNVLGHGEELFESTVHLVAQGRERIQADVRVSHAAHATDAAPVPGSDADSVSFPDSLHARSHCFHHTCDLVPRDNGVLGPVVSFSVYAKVSAANRTRLDPDADRAGRDLGNGQVLEPKVALCVDYGGFHEETLMITLQ